MQNIDNNDIQNNDIQNNDIIVGLAGHIDHGKTALIKALNGFDGDEWSEEKQRGITLDLSFSNLALPSRNVAFIDVPGHSKLVKNMIAGSFGIDVLLLVVAANEGLMPQSLEHVKIANLLGIKTCICVISKIDKLENANDLKTLESSIEALFSKTEIALDSIFALNLLAPDSSVIANIKSSLANIAKPSKEAFKCLMYYVDRSFVVKGSGCVVTGSLLSGSIALNDKLCIYHNDSIKEVQIRSIEVHNKPCEVATPSHRVALNLAHISHNDIKRGYLISQKGFLRGFDSIDVALFDEVNHNESYQLYIGSFKCSAKVSVLESSITKHYFGSKAITLATLKCDSAVFSLFSQHFILKNDSSLSGGVVLNPITESMKKPQKIALLKALAQRDFVKAFKMLSDIHKKGFGLVSATQRFNLSHSEALSVANSIDNIFVDEKSLTIYPHSQIEVLKTHILDIFTRNANALLSAASLTFKAKWASNALCQVALDALESEHLIKFQNGLYLSKRCNITNIDSFVQEKILEVLTNAHLEPPAPYNIYESLDIDKRLGDSAFKALTQSQKVVRLAHNLFVESSAIAQIVALMRETIHTKGFVDVNNLREKTSLSRKYLIGYLEYLDKFSDIICKDNKRYFKYAQGKSAQGEQ